MSVGTVFEGDIFAFVVEVEGGDDHHGVSRLHPESEWMSGIALDTREKVGDE